MGWPVAGRGELSHRIGPASPEPDGLWDLARHHGITRRRFLSLLALGGAAAVLAACGQVGQYEAPPAPDSPTPADSPWFKDPTPFIQHDKSLESRLELMHGLTTPNHLFFVRNNSLSVDVRPTDWRLSVEGDATVTPLQLSYDDLLRFPSRTVVSYLECGGNHRAMFDLVQGKAAEGTQWKTGGIGNAEWTGVPLRDVLAQAGAMESAVSVLLVGSDKHSPEEGFRQVLPIGKAMDPDTLLAYAMNGEALPKDHGYPLRALVPAWVGSYSIKWLDRIEVSSQQLWTRNNTSSYVLIGDDYPPEGEALGQVTSAQVVKSALALPWPARLSTGPHVVYGYAQSPHGPISRIEWSTDFGHSWSEAPVLPPQVQHSWARFEIQWNARAGEHILMTRATDSAGNVQPDTIPFNQKGYLFNQPLPHPVVVT